MGPAPAAHRQGRIAGDRAGTCLQPRLSGAAPGDADPEAGRPLAPDPCRAPREPHAGRHHSSPCAVRRRRARPVRQSLGLARVALDIAREHGIRAGTVAVDSALRLGATYGELEFSLARMKHWPGVSHARASLALSDPDTDPSQRRSGASWSRSWVTDAPRPSSASRRTAAWCGATCGWAATSSRSMAGSSCRRSTRRAGRRPAGGAVGGEGAAGLRHRLQDGNVPHRLGRLLGSPA